MMTAAKTEPNRTLTAVAMRSDQWDLIVLALSRIRLMTMDSEANVPNIDKLGRLFLRRRCVEAMADIQQSVPEAGEQK